MLYQGYPKFLVRKMILYMRNDQVFLYRKPTLLNFKCLIAFMLSGILLCACHRNTLPVNQNLTAHAQNSSIRSTLLNSKSAAKTTFKKDCQSTVFTFRYGNAPSFTDPDKPLLFQLYGDRGYDFYNTRYIDHKGSPFKIDEPDNFGQLGYLNYRLLLMKQKIHPLKNGFKLEATTAFELGWGNRREIWCKKWFSISSDFSITGGITVADAKFSDDSGNTVSKRFAILGYGPVGYSATVVERLDFNFTPHFSVFMAGNLHHYQGSWVNTSIGGQRFQYVGSGEITVGIGFNLWKK